MRVFLEYWDRWFELQPGETLVGRDQSCPIQIDDDAISRRHLRLSLDSDAHAVFAEDLLSTNGSRLNDAELSTQQTLQHGDVLQLGHGALVVHILEEHDDRVAELATKVVVERTGERPLRRDPTGSLASTCPPCDRPLPGPDLPCSSCEVVELPRRDRRREPRIQTTLPVRYKSSTARFSSLVCDISLGGAFIASEVSEAPVTSCRITVVPDDGPPFSAEGEVRHVATAESALAGFGIKFTALEYHGREWIYNAVENEMSSFADTSPSFQ